MGRVANNGRDGYELRYFEDEVGLYYVIVRLFCNGNLEIYVLGSSVNGFISISDESIASPRCLSPLSPDCIPATHRAWARAAAATIPCACAPLNAR
jgi:hypothetical protein